MVFPKGANLKVSENFHVGEFEDKDDSPTNHFTLIAPALVALLQRLRERIDSPITITSGFRTERTNIRVGGAAHSYHTFGFAADITSPSLTIGFLYGTIINLLEVGKLPELGGLGFYPKRNFIHVDVRPRIDGHVVIWEEEDQQYQQA